MSVFFGLCAVRSSYVLGKMEAMNVKLESIAKSLETVTGTTTDTNSMVAEVKNDLGTVKGNVDALTKSHEKLKRAVKKNEEKAAKNATNNVMVRKEQYNIKVAIERLHQLVERNRQESTRDKIEARTELRNVIFNKLHRKLLNRSYGGGASSKDLIAYAYDLICEITDMVRYEDVIAAVEIGQKAKNTFRLKIEMSSQHLAESIATVGRKMGYDARQGMLKSERDFLSAQHKLASAMNERNTSHPEYYFAVRRGTRIVLKEKATDKVVQEVELPSSDEVADCLVKFDLAIYADLAEGSDDEDEKHVDSPDEDMELEPEEAAELAKKREKEARELADRETTRSEARQEREMHNANIRVKPTRTRRTSKPPPVEPTDDDNNGEGESNGADPTTSTNATHNRTINLEAGPSQPQEQVEQVQQVQKEQQTQQQQPPNPKPTPTPAGSSNGTAKTAGKRTLAEATSDSRPPTASASKKTKKANEASEDSSSDEEVTFNGSSAPRGGPSNRRGRGGGRAGTSSNRRSTSSNPPKPVKPKMPAPTPTRDQPNRNVKKNSGNRNRRTNNQMKEVVMSQAELKRMMNPLVPPNAGGSSRT